ncbi:MAG: hypothetical protein ACT6FE_03920 [Methanosarcinaceae archaeon]
MRKNCINTNSFLASQTAFLSTVDALFFILIIPVAAVVLMPYT